MFDPGLATDDVHPGRLAQVRQQPRSSRKKARKRNGYVPNSVQLLDVGNQYSGNSKGGLESGSNAFLRFLGMDYHHPCNGSSGHFLPFSFDGVPLRHLEARLQSQV